MSISNSMDFTLKQDTESLFSDVSLYNSETISALEEYEEMKKNPGDYKRYDYFDDILNEVFNQ